MRHKRQNIASYLTHRGALRYAAELAKVWPSVTFNVSQHPYAFTWTVEAHMPNNMPEYAYVLERPRGGMTVSHALIPR